ncbi:Receptor-type tyrosine-protein phosphatase mu, partial [Lamellibrachia satsuma]
IDSGQCEEGHPNDLYRWSGTACQTGNVGYKKLANQSGENGNYWSKKYPASYAVDGDTNPDLDHNSCAVPFDDQGANAWWMVDLGQKYSISSVVIYNRKNRYNAARLSTFTLGVGNSPNSLTQCASHNGRVAPSGSVEKSCTAVGQYLRFMRDGGSELNIANLCEVVIIGHLFIDCQDDFCSSTCNDVIGCDACAPGRQQPDCKKPCEAGSYGVNCQEDCGHCKDTCDVNNGHCANGCKDWYISDVCKTYIPTPHFGTSQVPEVEGVNSSSAVVSWPKANDIPPSLEAHYYYVVWLQVDGATKRNVTQIVHHVGNDRFQSLIVGLVFNTHYSVKVEPYRQYQDKHEGGPATGVTSFKTSCIEKGKPQTWGSFVVESISEEKFADYVIRQFKLKNEKLKKMRRMRQFHFTGWPDKGTPEYAYPLLAFHRKVHGFDSEKRGPFVVHCSAGVGRTGTFIAIDILIEQAKAEGKVDVFQCVNLLRTQRMNMVQTMEQYIYVYQALIELSEVAVIPCSELRQTFEELCTNSKISEQFERLNALKPHRKNARCAALEPKNVAKNRFIEIIPDDHQRPYLVTPWKEGTNYINAVYVHGYKERNAYILTQSPMTATVVDMWRLLNDHESRTVVMLDDCDVTDDECTVYWPTKKATKQQYGPFGVELVDTVTTENTNVTVREFKLNKSGRSENSETVIKQFQLNHSWSDDSSLPSNTTVLLDLLDAVEKWQQQSGNGPIVVHCTDGASRCGLLCATSYVLEHMKVEQEVDVFHAVQHVRTTRPQLVTHLPQYRFLYELALA